MTKTRKSTYSVEEKQIVDMETGEIGTIETIKRHKISLDTEPFYMVFIDYVAPLYNISNGNCKNVLAWMCTHATFNTGRISLSSQDRTTIMNQFKISKATLSNTLHELCEKKLISGDRGTYIINPQIFWKGDLLTRKAILDTKEIQVTFSIDPKDAGLTEK